MEYQREKAVIQNKYKGYYEEELAKVRKKVKDIEGSYKAELQGGMIGKVTDGFRSEAETLQKLYKEEVEKLIKSVEKKMAKKEEPEEKRKLTENEQIISLMTKQNELLEKNGKLSILLERTREFDEEYLIELLDSEFNKKDKDIYNLVVSKVNALDRETTKNVRNKMRELTENTPEKIFQRFRGNFNMEMAGAFGHPSFSNFKLQTTINEMNNPYEGEKSPRDKKSNPYY